MRDWTADVEASASMSNPAWSRPTAGGRARRGGGGQNVAPPPPPPGPRHGGPRQSFIRATSYQRGMSFRTGPAVFKDRAKVSFDYGPEKLLHREAQVQRLFSIFRPVGDSGIPANAFLFGSVGTGKTHTAKRFCEDFRRYANEHGRGLDHVHVNCRQKMGDDAVLLHILKHFDERFPDRGFSIPEKLDSLRKHLEKKQVHLVQDHDEVDLLLLQVLP